jgi:transcriptional regulator
MKTEMKRNGTMRGEALKGHLDLLILAVVSFQSSHGYAIIEALHERSGGAFDLQEGTVYPALHRLERGGLLSSRWETAENGRNRRIYEITLAGRATLQLQRSDWEQFSEGVNSILQEVRTSCPL